MKIVETINVVKDFTDTPGARVPADGPFSGKDFLVKILEPKFISAMEKQGKLQIDLSDSYGYPSSFISESFGKLSVKYGAEKCLETLIFIAHDDAFLIEKIIEEINNP